MKAQMEWKNDRGKCKKEIQSASRENWTNDPLFTRQVLYHWAMEAAVIKFNKIYDKNTFLIIKTFWKGFKLQFLSQFNSQIEIG